MTHRPWSWLRHAFCAVFFLVPLVLESERVHGSHRWAFVTPTHRSVLGLRAQGAGSTSIRVIARLSLVYLVPPKLGHAGFEPSCIPVIWVGFGEHFLEGQWSHRQGQSMDALWDVPLSLLSLGLHDFLAFCASSGTVVSRSLVIQRVYQRRYPHAAATLCVANNKAKHSYVECACQFFQSQSGQDRFLVNRFFQQEREERDAAKYVQTTVEPLFRRMYVDVGSWHSRVSSNTWYFDQCLGWKGICIEPNPVLAAMLRRSDRTCEVVEKCASGQPERLKLTTRHVYDPIAFVAADLSGRNSTGSLVTTWVECLPLQEILSARGVQRVDYMNIDIEGHETSVLAAIDFSKTHIALLSVENGLEKLPARIYEKVMFRAGFHKISRVGADDMWEQGERGLSPCSTCHKHYHSDP